MAGILQNVPACSTTSKCSSSSGLSASSERIFSMREIENALTPPLAAKLAGKRNVDFSAGDDPIFEAAFEMFSEAERESEGRLWDRIKEEYCRGGLAVTGADEVLKAGEVAALLRY